MWRLNELRIRVTTAPPPRSTSFAYFAALVALAIGCPHPQPAAGLLPSTSAHRRHRAMEYAKGRACITGGLGGVARLQRLRPSVLDPARAAL